MFNELKLWHTVPNTSIMQPA